jgi:uncharacterized protein involved in outer membrane biogenesis
MKKNIILVIVLLIIGALLFVGKNFIAKTSVTRGVKAVTGLTLDMGSMNVGIKNTMVGINNMKLYNPAGYTDKVMVDMPEIYIDYNLSSFLKRKAHLEEVRIDLKELTVIKDKKGKLNIDALKVVKDEKGVKKEKTAKQKKKTEIKIDILDLKIGKVAYRDFSKGETPKVYEYNINHHQKYRNITDLDQLAKLILTKAIINTNIARLANFNLGTLTTGLPETLKRAADIEEGKKKITETVEKSVEDFKETLKLPFGKQAE